VEYALVVSVFAALLMGISAMVVTGLANHYRRSHPWCACPYREGRFLHKEVEYALGTLAQAGPVHDRVHSDRGPGRGVCQSASSPYSANQIRDLFRVSTERLGGETDSTLDSGITDSAQGQVRKGLSDLKDSGN